MQELARSTVVLTGASGFIGRRLRRRLLDAGADVVSLRRKSSPGSEEGRSAEIDYGDLEGLTALMTAEKPGYVFHVAGVTKGVSYADFQRGNVLPTRNLLEALVRAGHRPRRFVHVSSLAAYGPATAEGPLTEQAPRQPVEHYGESKREAEEVVESYADRVDSTIIRPSGVYGPGDVDYFELFKQAARGLNVFFGNRARSMSVVYVEDVVEAILSAAQAHATVGRGYFICDGRPVTFAELQAEICKHSGRKVRDLDLPEVLVSIAALAGEWATALDKKPRLFNRQKATMGRQQAWTCTHAAARADFGYSPRVALAEGIAETWSWYRRERWL